MRCPNCGTELPDTAAFCLTCGTRMTPPPNYQRPPSRLYPPNPGIYGNYPPNSYPGVPPQNSNPNSNTMYSAPMQTGIKPARFETAEQRYYRLKKAARERGKDASRKEGAGISVVSMLFSFIAILLVLLRFATRYVHYAGLGFAGLAIILAGVACYKGKRFAIAALLIALLAAGGGAAMTALDLMGIIK